MMLFFSLWTFSCGDMPCSSFVIDQTEFAESQYLIHTLN